MSLVVLKRKSIRYQAKISGKGSKGFSINGGLRNQGWVGQTTLGRHLSKTPFRGNLPMGNGGCCGNYDVSILSGSNCCTNDPNIIKRSTMNTSPYILASVEHPTPVFIPNCTKGCLKNTDSSFIDFTPFIHSQGNYIKHKRNVHNREELCCILPKSDEDKSKVCPCPDVSKDVNIQSSNEYTERGVLHKNGLPTHIHHHHAITKSSTVVPRDYGPCKNLHVRLKGGIGGGLEFRLEGWDYSLATPFYNSISGNQKWRLGMVRFSSKPGGPATGAWVLQTPRPTKGVAPLQAFINYSNEKNPVKLKTTDWISTPDLGTTIFYITCTVV